MIDFTSFDLSESKIYEIHQQNSIKINDYCQELEFILIVLRRSKNFLEFDEQKFYFEKKFY